MSILEKFAHEGLGCLKVDELLCSQSLVLGKVLNPLCSNFLICKMRFNGYK